MPIYTWVVFRDNDLLTHTDHLSFDKASFQTTHQKTGHATMLYLLARARDECDDSAPCGGNMNEAADTLILFVVGTPMPGVHALCRG